MATLLNILQPVAYASLPLIALQYSPRGRYYTRSVVYVGALGFVATLSAFFAAGLSLVNRRFDVNYVVAKTFYAVAGTLVGWRVEVEGEEWLRDANDGGGRPAVLMCNHQSMVDILPLARIMPKRTSIMSKKSLRFTPLGPFMLMSGAIFIDRGNSDRAKRSLDAAANVMRTLRVSLWMFPEGTRHNSQTPDLLPFKKGGFHLAIQSGLPVIPIVIENYYHLYRKNEFKTGVIRIRVLPPVHTTGMTAENVPTLITTVRDQMLAALKDISTKAPSTAPAKSIAPPDPAALSSVAAVISDVVDDHTTAIPEDAVFEAIPAPATVPVSASKESLASSSFEGVAGSENGTETEEDDEGMVLVGRPT
ncbi:1-acyl-sn-glycerol-3-phosphate acyltransferase [Mycena sanguinolenta]|uniref:1-acyl-sn-glycerol-3-phosphate acyltransferase n=1 Tax=Mycena sanguinolenta TaxID=230812 RepID=A0A8H6YCF2_9AGAR|nr:1-acyl-sn-glycerol-3-phosphate acyltransferase [Mycena sanguinolenta]